MTTYSFSQSSYPKKILWGTDTVLAITKPQLIKINRTINDYIHLKSYTKLLEMDLHFSDSISNHWKATALKMDSICLLERTRYENACEINKQLNAELRRGNLKFKIGVGVGGTVLALLIGLAIIK